MDDVTAIFDEDEIMIPFSDDYYVFDDVYALPIAIAEKLLAQLEAALREARGPHGRLFRKCEPSDSRKRSR
jgi:hypothetical protein